MAPTSLVKGIGAIVNIKHGRLLELMRCYSGLDCSGEPKRRASATTYTIEYISHDIKHSKIGVRRQKHSRELQ